MRVGRFLGKRVVLSDEEWEKCLRRVDTEVVTKFYSIDGNKYRINADCPFCSAVMRACSKCPLRVFASRRTPEVWGCVTLFKRLAEKLKVKDSVGLFDAYISWDEEEDEDARLILNKVHARLLKMRRK